MYTTAFMLTIVMFVGFGVFGLVKMMRDQGGYLKFFIISGVCLVVLGTSSYLELSSQKKVSDPVTIVEFDAPLERDSGK